MEQDKDRNVSIEFGNKEVVNTWPDREKKK